MITATMFRWPSPASTPAKPKVISEGIGTQHASRNPNRKIAARPAWLIKLSMGHCCTACGPLASTTSAEPGGPLTIAAGPGGRRAARRGNRNRTVTRPSVTLPPEASSILDATRDREPIVMPIATPEVYAQMLDRAKQHGFAYPAINVTSSQTLNAALRGFADAESDGIVQVSTGGAEYLSGAVKDMVTGSVALASFARSAADKYPMHVALHTDHCPAGKLDGFMRPLVKLSQERVARGEDPLFGSHMWDGSAVPLKENLAIASELLDECAKARIIMEMEIGVVGGEEDGVVGQINEKLYTTPEDALATAEALGLGERGRYILAATFGNVHGVYKPGHVKLRPTVLKEIQDAVGAKYGKDKPFDLVFHGGSGSAPEEIREAIGYGVVKMNVDTDTQYAFTRPVAAHMFTNYDGVLKVDGEVGNKKTYDPRVYLKKAEASMAARVQHACEDLMSAGHALGR